MKGALAIRKPVQTVAYDLSSGAITNAAYVAVLAKASNKVACSGLEIFNPSGSTLKIAIGDAGSEVDIPYTVPPGGSNLLLAVELPAKTRISMKALDAGGTGTVGLLLLNWFG